MTIYRTPGTVHRPAPAYTMTPTQQSAPGVVSRQRSLLSAPLRMQSPAATLRRYGLHGLGQTEGVSERWKYAALGLGALVVAQFFWWNAKAPQVLRLGGY